MTGGSIVLEELTKRFGDQVAVDAVSLEVRGGEFFSLLGPSGCGKTTTLRMIGGFEEPTSGRILLDGAEVGHLPPNRRPVNTVFQSYALFPFLDVAGNVAFGLKFARLGRDESRRRVAEALDLVQLTGYERRRPSQLSGGQQQRVALARALVLRPSVLLLDEPLGALDAKLRRSLQVELKALQERVGITFLYVTHDQEEALTMSDRLAVMSNGRIAQLGTPREVYEEPASAYVADFLGVSNLMDAVATPGSGGTCRVRIGEFEIASSCGAVSAAGPVKVAIRPERVGLAGFEETGPNRVPAMVERAVFVGAATQVIVRLAAGATLQALVANDGQAPALEPGTPVQAVLPADAVRVLADEGASVAEIHEETYGEAPPSSGAGPGSPSPVPFAGAR
ncbi:MAG TPA: ABC transporter ATP-binding protein [Acidimicrobiales bacterium]|nr:ABC transporter ATP-binding protein [Acidimicrobiales bacterium]